MNTNTHSVRRRIAGGAVAALVLPAFAACGADIDPPAQNISRHKVDKDTKKITLKHAEIPNLEMPGMTMLFQVTDPAMLDLVKVGDKVKFKAEKVGGAIVITEMQALK
jgi:Cu/Ag efflux protein CusF